MKNETDKAVEAAIRLGYRHIDTAQAHENEDGIGIGLKACGISREEIFVTTTVRAERKTYESAAASIDKSLRKLDTGYIDLVIIHLPQPWEEFWEEENRYFVENREAWRALEDAYKAGKLKVSGLSNFLWDDLENSLASCEIRPMVNQVLCHVSVAQTYLKYDLQLGAAVLPKPENGEHMKNNAGLDFTIADADMDLLKKVKKQKDYGRDKIFPSLQKDNTSKLSKKNVFDFIAPYGTLLFFPPRVPTHHAFASDLFGAHHAKSPADAF